MTNSLLKTSALAMVLVFGTALGAVAQSTSGGGTGGTGIDGSPNTGGGTDSGNPPGSNNGGSNSGGSNNGGAMNSQSSGGSSDQEGTGVPCPAGQTQTTSGDCRAQ